MTKSPERSPKKVAPTRQGRLKAALKANMAKRKAQSRARMEADASDTAKSGQ